MNAYLQLNRTAGFTLPQLTGANALLLLPLQNRAHAVESAGDWDVQELTVLSHTTGANCLDFQTDEGFTALHLAARAGLLLLTQGRSATVALLLEQGADPSITDENGTEDVLYAGSFRIGSLAV